MEPQKRDRAEIYDWVRGLAALAVVLGHFEPFDIISKGYFVWSVHAFVLVTMALVSGKSFGIEKFFRRFLYVIFVYTALVFIFRMFFIIQADSRAHVSYRSLFLNPVTMFLRNPYFDHLWYIGLYAQMLIFLVIFCKKLKNISAAKVLLISIFISQAIFLATYYELKRYTTVLLPSWFFVMAVGWYIFPGIVERIGRTDDKRGLRSGAIFTSLCLLFSQKHLFLWLKISEARTCILNTCIFFIVIYFLVEIFFLIKPFKVFKGPIKLVCFISQFTLILYIYHQGIHQIFAIPPAGYDAFVWALFSLITGIPLAYAIHHSYLWLEIRAGQTLEKIKLITALMKNKNINIVEEENGNYQCKKADLRQMQ